MNRRNVLAGTGMVLSVPLVGCLGSTAGEDEEDSNGTDENEDDDGGSREALDLWLYNYRDEAVNFTIDADADGESVVSAAFELEAPETVFTDKVVATFPEDTKEATVEATVDFDDRQKEEKKSFDLPREDPISGFEVKLDSHGTLSIDALPYDFPG